MKTVAFVIPYIGKLPESFPIFLKSCEKNPTVDFLMYIDDHEKYDFPDNVKVKYVTFEMLKGLFQKNFNFEICIPQPYKFCDFKPMYGEIFAEDLIGYDFWGFCDIDLVWGDIRRFVNDAILNSYIRIYSRGHCSIFPNTDKARTLYKTLPTFQYQDWRDVVSSPDSRCYDEWGKHVGGGLSKIMSANGIEMYDNRDMADIDVRYGRFHIHGYGYIPQFFVWEDGRLKAYDDDGNLRDEFIYVHFQKRTMCVNVSPNKNLNKFYIAAPYFIGSSEVCRRKYRLRNIKFEIDYRIKKIKRTIIKIIKRLEYSKNIR